MHLYSPSSAIRTLANPVPLTSCVPFWFIVIWIGGVPLAEHFNQKSFIALTAGPGKCISGFSVTTTTTTTATNFVDCPRYSSYFIPVEECVWISTLLHWPVFQLLILRLAFTSHKPLKEFVVGVGVAVGIVSGVVSAQMTLWKSKLGVVSRVFSATESESEESERFHFPPTPLMTPSITINWNQIVGFGGIRTLFSPDRKVLCLVPTIGTESV